jgi:hypothetical protein
LFAGYFFAPHVIGAYNFQYKSALTAYFIRLLFLFYCAILNSKENEKKIIFLFAGYFFAPHVIGAYNFGLILTFENNLQCVVGVHLRFVNIDIDSSLRFGMTESCLLSGREDVRASPAHPLSPMIVQICHSET